MIATAGIDVRNTVVMLIQNVLEPVIVKEQIIKSATEAACMILRVDDVIASSKSKTPPMPPADLFSIGFFLNRKSFKISCPTLSMVSQTALARQGIGGGCGKGCCGGGRKAILA